MRGEESRVETLSPNHKIVISLDFTLQNKSFFIFVTRLVANQSIFIDQGCSTASTRYQSIIEDYLPFQEREQNRNHTAI